MSSEAVSESELALDFESNPESEFGLEKRLGAPPLTAPAAAAVARIAAEGGLADENAGEDAGEDEDDGVSFLGGTGLAGTAAAGLGKTGGAEVSGVAGLDGADANLLAAAARAAGFTAIFGGWVVRLGSAAFLLFSLHFSRSSSNSRAL